MNFLNSDRNGGYFKVFLGFIYMHSGYNVFLNYTTVWS